MTATLRIRLEKDFLGRGSREGLVADIYALDDDGHRLQALDQRNIIIPAGGAEVGARAVSVEPGNYVVEATYPSGEVVSEQLHVADGDDRAVTLTGPDSPDEWLGWQQFIGNVPDAADVAARHAGPRPPAKRVPTGTADRIDHFVRTQEFRHLHLKEGGPGATRRRRRSSKPAWPAVWFVRWPNPPFGGEGGGDESWTVFGRDDIGDRVLQTVPVNEPVKAKHQFEREDWRRYAFGGDGSLPFGRGATSGGDTLPRRYVVGVRARGIVELACLPVPWESGFAGQVPVELLVRRNPKPGEAMLAMSPDDPVVRSMVGYMGTGAWANARLMFDQAKDLLFGKMINPLGAAAGGYILLATQAGTERQPWHDWIANLANWFEWLPDGMIQYGRLRLVGRKGKDDVAEARKALFAAFDRGIPYYSLGLQWLVDGLSLLASADDPEASRRLAAAQRVAWRANLQQPFTTLRLRD